MIEAPLSDLATDSRVRVIVFVDGQNLYKESERLFGHALCHPHLLAEHLAGPRIGYRVGCRFYSGRPSPNVDPAGASHFDRRISAMSGRGVTTVTRPLRYHWDWGHQDKLPPPVPEAAPQTVTLTPWQRPHEKGIDLAIALDVIEFLITGVCDVAIIVSLDRDLAEIPLAARNLKGLIRRNVRLEAAVPVADDLPSPKMLSGFAMTHQITRAVFDLIRDDTDYTVPADRWVAPVLPVDLAARRAAAGQQ
jgi:uncharacterized LabA/DUF88 family protein